MMQEMKDNIPDDLRRWVHANCMPKGVKQFLIDKQFQL